MTERRRRNVVTIGIVAVLLGGAGVIAWLLLATAPEPQRSAPPERGALVRVVEVARKPHRLRIHAHGSVRAARTLVLRPEVSGRLIWVHPQLEPGGVIAKGDVLFRIDPRPYELAVRRIRAELARASSTLAMERARRSIAEREMKLFRDIPEEQFNRSLMLREPQLEAAKAAVLAAQAAIGRAELDLERTSVSAPFNAIVDSEDATLGSLVTRQSRIATLLGTGEFWVEAPIPAAQVSHLDLPEDGQRGASVDVRHQVGGRTLHYRGQVVRLLGTTSEQTRLARVLISIADPLHAEVDGEDPRRIKRLLPAGTWVDLVITGGRERLLVEVPEAAIVDGPAVYIVEDGKLRQRDVRIAWRGPNRVLVDSGLRGGDRVIVSQLARPVPGMKVRVADD